MSLLSDFVSIVFPDSCLTCFKNLFKDEKYFCLECLDDLPKTMFLNMNDNPVYKLFDGRIEVNRACSYLEFNEGNKTQEILHQIKYADNPRLGYHLGKIMGNEMKNNYGSIDLVIPIPLHPFKKLARGYNQSEHIAKGIANGLNVKMNTSVLRRIKKTDTQTKKGRFQRWQNVSDIFEFDPKKIEANHVLFVDDVITTGSTMESAISAIDKKIEINISVATLARSG